MLDRLFGPHIENIGKSMSLATQRHAMLVNNLANVNTPGYKRQDIDFNLQLEGEIGAQMNGSSMRTRSILDSNSRGLRIDGNSVDIEHEIVSLAETEIRYQALVDMMAKQMKGLQSAISEGRK